MSFKKSDSEIDLSSQVPVRRTSYKNTITFDESNKQNASEISHIFSSRINENKKPVILSASPVYIYSPLHKCFV